MDSQIRDLMVKVVKILGKIDSKKLVNIVTYVYRCDSNKVCGNLSSLVRYYHVLNYNNGIVSI